MMDEEFDLAFKGEIESLRESPNFEELGDAMFLAHPDRKARATWAFYRPSGSHPSQIEDEDVFVSIMAFNQSRLGALDRFSKLHPDVLKDEKLRVMIEKRARMLFRAMADDNFCEMAAALARFDVYIPLAIDQICNGRMLNEEFEVDVDMECLSRFLDIIGAPSEKLESALKARLKKINNLTPQEIVTFYKSLKSKKEKLHAFLIKRFNDELDDYIRQNQLHILQKTAIIKECKI